MSTEEIPDILVMMATYNGENYVAEQIDSILAQEGVNVHIRICDDGSTDDTPSICSQYAKDFDNVDFSVNSSNKGVAKNFMDMVYEADPERYDYFAFSDQDDFWLPNKLREAIDLLKDRPDEPLLYYSDVCNVDADLQGEQYDWRIFSYNAKSIETLMIRNTASGCTEVFNRPLLKLITSVVSPDLPELTLHDYWIHLIALSCGDAIVDLERSFIKRRITGYNELGQSRYSVFDARRIKNLLTWVTITPDRNASNTARRLLESYKDRMHPEMRAEIEKFAKEDKSIVDCIKLAANRKYNYPTFRENFILHMRLLFDRF